MSSASPWLRAPNRPSVVRPRRAARHPRRRSRRRWPANSGPAQDVALPGFRDNAAAYMARSALFVRSSAWEELPTVLIEVLAAGARVVSTDRPSGPREILQEGRLGGPVPMGDPVALTDARIDALDRPRGALPLDALTPFTRGAAVEHYLRLIESA
jgi:glycosyltransferase involved in cell wall biosynthesis